MGNVTYPDGRFEEALSSLDQLTGLPADLRGETLRLKGHVYRVNALPGPAEASYREALDLARQTANVAAEGKALTDLVQTLAWSRPAEARELQPCALEVNQALRSQVELVKIHAATAVALTNLGDLDDATAQIAAGLDLAQQCEYRGGLVWCQVARTLNQLKRGDHEASRDSAARLAATVTDLQGNRFWSEIVNWWIGYASARHPASSTSWLEGEDSARTRWLAVLPSRDRDYGTCACPPAITTAGASRRSWPGGRRALAARLRCRSAQP
jgi:tetratricopeptide (TPR) repeat protein